MKYETAIRLRDAGFPRENRLYHALKPDGTTLMHGDLEENWIEVPTCEELALAWLKDNE